MEALDLARYDELPEAQLPWLEVDREAKRQGVSEADVVWDMAGRLPEPACEPIDLTSRLYEIANRDGGVEFEESDDFDDLDDEDFEIEEGRWAA